MKLFVDYHASWNVAVRFAQGGRGGAVLTGPKMQGLDGRVRDVTPAKLPDLFERDQVGQSWVNRRHGYWDANRNCISISIEQQVNDRAFFRRGNRWVGSFLVDRAQAPPKRTI